MSNEVCAGALYVVATPIGNRADMSSRACQILAGVDCVAAEDTRVTGALLASLDIKATLVSLHEHNENQRVPVLLSKLAAGQSVALVSDAGTPLISDPGFALVRAVRAAGHEVLTVPGPCAAIAALSVSGLATDRFLFAGFAAAKSAARLRQFEDLLGQHGTLIFYVSKRQVEAVLRDARSVFGDQRQAALARELTKLHETTLSGTLAQLAELWSQATQRGELVLLIGGSNLPAEQLELDATLAILLEKVSTRDAAALAARLLRVAKKEAYARALVLAGKGDQRT